MINQEEEEDEDEYLSRSISLDIRTYEVTDMFAPVTRRPPLLFVVKRPDTEFVL